MFFVTLLIFSGILFLAGLLNLPLMVYFWNFADDTNDEDGDGVNNNNNDKSGVDYMGVGMSIRASALCDRTEWVECPSCHYTEHLSDYPEYRLKVDANDNNGGMMTYLVRRNVCDFSQFGVPGTLSYIASMLILVLTTIFLVRQKRAEIVIDESVQTASDYSIKISNPPKDATDPQEWKEFFDQFVDANEDLTATTERVEETTAGETTKDRTCGGGVALVTVAINNGQLIQQLIKRRKKLEQLEKLLIGLSTQHDDVKINNLTTMDNSSVKALVDEAASSMMYLDTTSSSLYKQCHRLLLKLLGLQNDPLLLWEEIGQIESNIRYLVEYKDYSAVSVFVTFNTERSQRNALHALSTGKLNIWQNQWNNALSSVNLEKDGSIHVKESDQSSNLWDCSDAHQTEHRIQLSFRNANSGSECLMFRGERVLKVKEAVEPSDVRWMELSSPVKHAQKLGLYFASAFGMLLFISWSGYFIYKLTMNYPSSYAAMFITLVS